MENEGHVASCEDRLPGRRQSPARLMEDLLVQARGKSGVQSLAKSSHIPNASDLCALLLSIPSQRPHGEVKSAHCNLLPKLRFVFRKRRDFQKCVNLRGNYLSTSKPRAARTPRGALLLCAPRSCTERPTLDVGFCITNERSHT